jgi:NAD(P)H-hydrate epimerase
VPQFSILNIGLHTDLDNLLETPCFFVTHHVIRQLLKKRPAFSHKGHFGHALLLAGSSDMKGAALLSAKSVLKSGAGLLSVHTINAVLKALTSFLPEAMSSTDSDSSHISSLPPTEKYSAIAIGPGIGMHPDTVQVLKKLLNYHQGIPLVLDADAITILSENKTWLSFLPPETILTPHPKEFDRLTQTHYSDFERWESAKHFSQKHACILVLKGKFTIICMPDGSSYFNSSGNAGMAKGGSGDVLTGIILGLLARGYTAPKSALIGVFVHGLAADIAIENSSMESLLASDLIDYVGKAFYRLEPEKENLM